LSDKQATDATVDTEDLEPIDDAKTKTQVIPYVQDTRNVLLVRGTQRLDMVAATSLRYALERGIEATFQLEDSELDSTALPDPDRHGRMLFTESAEGGAGVLRRLVSDADALAQVAATALGLLHFDPVTGADLGHAEGTTERCELGCYDCLLSFANQSEHELIDRHQARDVLVRLAGSTTEAGGGGRDRGATVSALLAACDSELERRFVTWLDEHGLRLPDRAQVYVHGAQSRPDFVYDLPPGPVAVFVDGPVHEGAISAERDSLASERLMNGGWDVIRVAHDTDWGDVVAARPTVFGALAGPQT
jgi:hypothetical protein